MSTPDELDTLLSDVDSPKHAKKQTALDQFKAVFGNDATLMDACLGLRMACNGSGDPIPDEEKDRCMSALEERLRSWSPAHGPLWAAFDEAVRQVVVATLIEVGARSTT